MRNILILFRPFRPRLTSSSIIEALSCPVDVVYAVQSVCFVEKVLSIGITT